MIIVVSITAITNRPRAVSVMTVCSSGAVFSGMSPTPASAMPVADHISAPRELRAKAS